MAQRGSETNFGSRSGYTKGPQCSTCRLEKRPLIRKGFGKEQAEIGEAAIQGNHRCGVFPNLLFAAPAPDDFRRAYRQFPHAPPPPHPHCHRPPSTNASKEPLKAAAQGVYTLHNLPDDKATTRNPSPNPRPLNPNPLNLKSPKPLNPKPPNPEPKGSLWRPPLDFSKKHTRKIRKDDPSNQSYWGLPARHEA